VTFFNKYKTLNAGDYDNPNHVDENTILWQLEYVLQLHRKGLPFKEEKHDFFNYMTGMYVDDGLFSQLPDENVGFEQDRYTSLDQLIAYSIACRFFGKDKIAKHIWKWLLTHWFTYDNVSQKTNFKRVMRPDTLYVCAKATNSLWRFVFFPSFLIANIIKVFQYYKVRNGVKLLKVDGILILWLVLYGFEMKFLMKVFDYLMSKRKIFKSFDEAFHFYFKDENHPIRRVINKEP